MHALSRCSVLTAACALAGCIFAFGCGGKAEARGPDRVSLATEDGKTLYALGLALGQQAQTFGIDGDDVDLLDAGLHDGALGRRAAVSLQAYRGKLPALAQSRARTRAAQAQASNAAFLASAAREPRAVTTASGLVIRTTVAGSGAAPSPHARVRISYEGRLIDGTVFDSSRGRGVTATLPLDGAIACWREALARMTAGDRAILTCPAALAFGAGGRPPTVPGGVTLIYDMELIEVLPP